MRAHVVLELARGGGKGVCAERWQLLDTAEQHLERGVGLASQCPRLLLCELHVVGLLYG